MIVIKSIEELNVLISEIQNWNFSVEGYDLDKPRFLKYQKDQTIIRADLTWGVNKIISFAQNSINIDLINKKFNFILHGLYDNNRVKLKSSSALPSGLVNNQYYYIIESTANSFKLSSTLGGSPVNILSLGTGNLTISCNKFQFSNTEISLLNNRFDISNSLLNDGDQISFDTESSSFLAWPLDIGRNYFVVNSNISNFQISLTSGGSPVSFINTGGAIQYYLMDYGAENNIKNIKYEISNDGGMSYTTIGNLRYNYSNLGKLLGTNWL